MKLYGHIIYGCLFLVLFFLVALALMSSSGKLGCESLSVLSMDKAGNLMGIFVSTFGLVVTVYFVVLTFKAKEVQENIEKVQENIKNAQKEIDAAQKHCNDGYVQLDEKKEQLQNDFEKLQSSNESFGNTLATIMLSAQKTEIDFKKLDEKLEQTKTCLSDCPESLYDIIDAQIAFAEINKAKELRNVLKLMQARLSYRCPQLDNKIRMKLFLELAAIGEKEDIDRIDENIKNEKDPMVKEIAQIALDELKKRRLT